MLKAYSSNTYTFLHFAKQFDPTALQRRKSSAPRFINYSKPSLKNNDCFQNMSQPPVKKEKRDPLSVTIRSSESFSNLFQLNT